MMLTKRAFVRGFIGAIVVGGAFGLRPLSAAEEGQSETLTGLLTARGENWIEVKADGAEKTTRYRPRWIGGLPADGGGFNKAVLEAIHKLRVPNRVRINWVIEEGPRVTGLEVLAPAEKSGTVTGTVTAKGEAWIEVTANGVADRYAPRWIGGLPKDGGGLDKAILEVISQAKVGDKVKLEWIYDERKRVVQLGKAE